MKKVYKNFDHNLCFYTNSIFTGVDRRPKLRLKAEAFFPSASASVAEAFGQKVWQKVWSSKRCIKIILKILEISTFILAFYQD